jgi:hypothetical protein
MSPVGFGRGRWVGTQDEDVRADVATEPLARPKRRALAARGLQRG